MPAGERLRGSSDRARGEVLHGKAPLRWRWQRRAAALPAASNLMPEKVSSGQVARWSRSWRSDGVVDRSAAVSRAFYTSGYESINGSVWGADILF
jgi:hypothetical protein